MPAAKTAPTMETTLAAIVAHPTRARAFTILTERTASPVEIAQEIGMRLKHPNIDARRREDVARHHPRWAAAGDDHSGVQCFAFSHAFARSTALSRMFP